MKVHFERVTTIDLRQLLGADATPERIEAHIKGIANSTAMWLGYADGVPAMAAGVIPYGHVFSEEVYIWVITTRLAEQHPLRLIRWSKKALDEIRKSYPIITGLCHCDNPAAQAWIKWLGAEFTYEDPHEEQFRFRFS